MSLVKGGEARCFSVVSMSHHQERGDGGGGKETADCSAPSVYGKMKGTEEASSGEIREQCRTSVCIQHWRAMV